MTTLQSYALSFVGRRANNEDTCLAIELNDSSFFYAVFDGMGGTEGGEFASQIVKLGSEEYLRKKFASPVDPHDLKAILSALFTFVQKKLTEEKKCNPALGSMGTTMTCLLFSNDYYVIGNVGDSRVYVTTRDSLIQATEDHTAIRDFEREQGYPLEEHLRARYASYITRSLDGGQDRPDLFPDTEPFTVVHPGEVFLLCSDGLILDKSSALQSDFGSIIFGTENLKQAAEQLIAQAYTSGSKDNITVVLVQAGSIVRSRTALTLLEYPPGTQTAPPQHAPEVHAAKSSRFAPPRFRTTVAALGVLIAAALLWYLAGGIRSMLSSETPAAPAAAAATPGRNPSAAHPARQPNADKTTYEDVVFGWEPSVAAKDASSGLTFPRDGEVPFTPFPKIGLISRYDVTIGIRPACTLITSAVSIPLSKIPDLTPGENYSIQITAVPISTTMNNPIIKTISITIN